MRVDPKGESRRLIVNADDLGQSEGVNRGIIAAIERGIVTSASLMVRWPAAESATQWARGRRELSIGLHVDLGEWACPGGEWTQIHTVLDVADAAAVDEELSLQLGRFVRMMGRAPTHLDSHQHVHREEPLRSMLLLAGERLGVPVRDHTSAVRYSGAFYGQWGRGFPYPEGITTAALLTALDTLPAGIVTELGCHPGADDITDLESMYLEERAVERAVLCDSCLPEMLAERSIELCSFNDVVQGGESGIV